MTFPYNSNILQGQIFDHQMLGMPSAEPQEQQNRPLTPIERVQVAEKKAQDAGVRSRNERKRYIEEQRRNEKSTSNVFWHLFLASSGAISLSVTFVGFYLSRLGVPPLRLSTLGVAWVFLLMSMVMCIARNLLMSVYSNLATWAMYLRREGEAREAEIELIELVGLQAIDQNTGMPMPKELPTEGREIAGEYITRSSTFEKKADWVHFGISVSANLALATAIAGTVTLVYFVYMSLQAINAI